MRFSIPRGPLLSALQVLQSVVERKNTIPILGNIVCAVAEKRLSLHATDLDIGVKLNLDISNPVEGGITVNARALLDIVRELPDAEITAFRKENDLLVLRCGRAQFQILGLPTEQYPKMDQFDQPTQVSLRRDLLINMIDRTHFAVSQDQTRYQITGVFLEIFPEGRLRVSATDGHRLSIVEENNAVDWPFEKLGAIMPKKGLLELRKVLDGMDETVRINANKGYLFMESTNLSLFLRFMEGEYPDYRPIIPNAPDKRITVARPAFTAALRRANLIANERNKGVKLRFDMNILRIESSNPDVGHVQEELELDYNQEPFEMAFNSRYLLDAMQVMKSDFVELSFSGPLAPALFHEAATKSHLYILMPMRL